MTFRVFQGAKDPELLSVTDSYLVYYKELFKDNFIGNFNTVKDLLSIKDNNTIYLVYEKDKYVGFIEFSLNDLGGNIKPYLEVEQMFLYEQYRNKMSVGNMFTLVCLVCDANGRVPVVGSTYTTSKNSHNNLLIGGEIFSQVFVFNPNEGKGKEFYDKSIERYEKRSKV